MFKKISFGFLLVIVLSGCSSMLGKDDFIEHVKGIEQSINQKNWKQSSELGQNLLKKYETNRWKLQLIGDEGEYEQLFRSINRLCAALEEQNNTQAKIELATIKAILDNIYSL